MNYRQQRALRNGSGKYLRVDDHDYLFNLEADARERANLANRHPERLAAMLKNYEEWEASIPPIPDDASVTLVYTKKDMP